MFLHWVWLLWVWGADVLAVICCSWALWRGSWVERSGALIIAVAWIMTAVLETPGQGPSLGDIIVDIAALGLLAGLAVLSRRVWVIFAAIVQLNAVFAHFVHPFTIYGNYSYATVTGFWSSFGLLACLALGVAGYRQRLKRSQRDSVKAPV